MKTLFSRIPLVALSVVLMIASALVSYFLVQENQEIISGLDRLVGEKEEQIEGQWESVNRFERNVQFATVIALLVETNGDRMGWQGKTLKEQYLTRTWEQSGLTRESFEEGVESPGDLLPLMDEVTRKRQEAVRSINDLYEEKITIIEQREKLKRDNSLYTALAFFINLMALVLVTVTREMRG